MQDVLNEKLTLVGLSISVFSGYRRATREHIAALGGKLPSCAALTEGSLKVFPSDGTNALATIRRGIFRKLQAKGVRALGSQNVFAVLTADLPEIEAELIQAKTEFDSELTIFGQQYDQVFEDHVAANHQAEAIIRMMKVEAQTAVSKCRFGSSIFKIAPVVREGQTEEEGVESIVQSLGRQLYEELADSMGKLLKNPAFERQKVGQKTLRPIKAELQKLVKLSFLDSSLDGAVKLVSEVLSVLPKDGYIEGDAFALLSTLVETLADADAALTAASRVKNGMDVFVVLCNKAPAAAVVEVTAPAEVKIAVLPQPPVLPDTAMQVLPSVPQVQRSTTPPVPAPTLRPREILKSNSLIF